MFDDSTKIILFTIVVTAWLGATVTEQSAPRDDLAIAVDTSRLPPLPLRASLDGSPAQTRVNSVQVSLNERFRAKLVNGYVIEGLVVTRREFRYDPTSTISPLDLGIVWGELAEPGGIDDIKFSTAPRAVWSIPSPNASLPTNWLSQVTNNHLIPANQAINDALMSIEVGARVRLRGYLVNVTGDSISPWRSSTLRGDSTIIGGCEIILVTGVEIIQVAMTEA